MELVVILADTTRTTIAVIHENEHKPYKKRAMRIRLTDEQEQALQPYPTGILNGEDTYEEILECWLE